ncbi:MAG: hypothetical protein DRJ62_07485 [Thermoprotei archaeon]|nr:MAG: hypothetical protein DRJ62_07485 [Thermoprotei archaeon]
MGALPSREREKASATTFRLLDKTIAQQLQPLAEHVGVLNQVAAEIGWFVIFAMMQVGRLDFDEIVEFAESVNEDPRQIFEFVRNQVNALILAARDLEAVQKLVEKVRDLELENKYLKIVNRALFNTMNAYRSFYTMCLSLMNKEQRTELIKTLAVKRMLGGLQIEKVPEGGVMA